MNTYPEKAMLYDSHKQRLAQKFSNDRKSYTKSKETMIQQLLLEANNWNMFDNND